MSPSAIASSHAALSISGQSANGRRFRIRRALDIALPPWFEVSFSYLTGDYDANNVLGIEDFNVALEEDRNSSSGIVSAQRFCSSIAAPLDATSRSGRPTDLPG